MPSLVTVRLDYSNNNHHHKGVGRELKRFLGLAESCAEAELRWLSAL